MSKKFKVEEGQSIKALDISYKGLKGTISKINTGEDIEITENGYDEEIIVDLVKPKYGFGQYDHLHGTSLDDVYMDKEDLVYKKGSIYMTHDNKAYIDKTGDRTMLSATDIFTTNIKSYLPTMAKINHIGIILFDEIPKMMAQYLAESIEDKSKTYIKFKNYLELKLQKRIVGDNETVLPTSTILYRQFIAQPDNPHGMLSPFYAYPRIFTTFDIDCAANDIDDNIEFLSYAKKYFNGLKFSEEFDGLVFEDNHSISFIIAAFILSSMEKLHSLDRDNNEEHVVIGLGTFKWVNGSVKLEFDKEFKCNCKIC